MNKKDIDTIKNLYETNKEVYIKAVKDHNECELNYYDLDNINNSSKEYLRNRMNERLTVINTLHDILKTFEFMLNIKFEDSFIHYRLNTYKEIREKLISDINTLITNLRLSGNYKYYELENTSQDIDYLVSKKQEIKEYKRFKEIS